MKALNTMMDYQYIEQLLQRYFDCNTTLQEEAILRAFFSQEDIPNGLVQYRDLFVAESELAHESLSDDFEARIMQQVEETMVHAKRLSLLRRMMPLYKAAAGVAIVLSLGFAAQQGITPQDATVTPRAARPAGEQVSVLPQDVPSVMQDTLLTVPK